LAAPRKPPPKPKFFPSPAKFRDWLSRQHEACAELWVGFYKKSSGRPSITYPEAVDQALCFGWIDGVRKSVTENAYMVRFTPRKADSRWSAINVKRAQALRKAGLMHSSGLRAFGGSRVPSRTYTYAERDAACLSESEEREFRANARAWEFFQSRPPWYRRTATFWIISGKREETRKKRLETLMKDSENGKAIKPLARSPVSKR